MAVKYCSDFPGKCCTSCHEEWEAGYHQPLEIYKGDELYAFVCCTKIDAAYEALEKEQ